MAGIVYDPRARRKRTLGMRTLFTALALLLLGQSSVFASDAAHGLPMHAPVVFDLGFFKITNSMIAMWTVAAVLIIFAQLAVRKISLVPAGLQNFLEAIVEGLEGFLGGIMGEKLARKTFWFFCSIFIFIACNNWLGLFPGVGTVGWKTVDAHGHEGFLPLLRGANADLNMTLGLAIVFFVLWIIWSIRANGLGGFLGHIFLYHGEDKGIMRVMLSLIFFVVGFLEVISIMIRPVTLTFRLFGNVYAGESLLETMVHLGGNFGWLTALPFYFLELMVGGIQALVFTLLTAVFTALMCQHDDHSEEAAH